jgi:hypothetical protein
MAVKYARWPFDIPTSSIIARPYKIFPKWNFWHLATLPGGDIKIGL